MKKLNGIFISTLIILGAGGVSADSNKSAIGDNKNQINIQNEIGENMKNGKTFVIGRDTIAPVEENNIKGDKESEEDHFLNCPNHSKDELDSLLQRSRNNIIKKIGPIEVKNRTSNCEYKIKEYRLDSGVSGSNIPQIASSTVTYLVNEYGPTDPGREFNETIGGGVNWTIASPELWSNILNEGVEYEIVSISGIQTIKFNYRGIYELLSALNSGIGFSSIALCLPKNASLDGVTYPCILVESLGGTSTIGGYGSGGGDPNYPGVVVVIAGSSSNIFSQNGPLVHEFGHLFGLPHNVIPATYMHPASALTATRYGINDRAYVILQIISDSPNWPNGPCEAPLAVKYISLNIKKNDCPECLLGKSAFITFVAEEVDNKGFMLQRSSDGESFETIETINSKGNNGSFMYSYEDKTLQEGIYYYRLVDIRSDGKQGDLSKIVSIELDNPKFRDFAILHNNPVKSGETFSIKKLRVGDKITICNIYGQIIQEQIIASEDLIKFSGENRGSSFTAPGESGMYIINIQGQENIPNTKQTLKIIVN